MTLEEIKAEIKRFKVYAEVEARIGKENEWNLGFQEGKVNAYEKCLDMLDDIEDLEPSWHPYPKERPPKDGEYIVTVPFEGFEQVTYAEFEQGRWLLPTFCYNCLGYADTPIAWMEKPKSYKKEEE